MKYSILSLLSIISVCSYGQHSQSRGQQNHATTKETKAIQTTDSQKVSKTATISLNGPIAKVFPLFNPIEEQKWVPTFKPEFVYAPNSTIQEGMSFKITGHGPDMMWIITKYDRKSLIQYLVSTPDRYWTITVQCKKAGKKTKADITYTFYAVNDEGIDLNKHHIHRMYAENLKDWEKGINDYLDK